MSGDGSLFCWGSNAEGQLGDASAQMAAPMPPVAP
jgi:hypothetical protein